MELNSKKVLDEWKSDLLGVARARGLFTELRLNIVRVGDREDSRLYVNNKVKLGEDLGIKVVVYMVDEDADQTHLNELMQSFKTPTILQLPIPKHLNHKEAIEHLDYRLDVDGLSIMQKGMLADGRKDAMLPATALGVVKLIESYCDITGMKVVIVNRSELIGEPLSKLILQRNGYPVVLHSKVIPYDLRQEMRSADVIVTGCGKRAIFDSSFAGDDKQLIIDCSMERVDGITGVGDFNKLDVLRETNCTIASGYGHTGPATVLGLMHNVLSYYTRDIFGNKEW